jgi:hypothetical protein
MSKAKKKTKSSHNSGGGSQQFLVWHGEKIIVAAVVVVALWFALKGLGYPALSWTPNQLEEVSTAAQKAIRENTRTAEDEKIEVFDYAAYAEQIKSPISAQPYRTEFQWNTTGFKAGGGQRSSAASTSPYE